MANSQTNLSGFNGSQSQVTTLNQIQGAGLQLPPNAGNFIDTRAPGKLEILLNSNNNDNALYDKNKFSLYQSQLLPPFYVTPNQGRDNVINATRSFPVASAIRDTRRILSFLTSTKGLLFLTKQALLQGFQPFDETKIYNIASPVVAASRLATLSVLERPKRHINLNSGIIGGISGALGLDGLLKSLNLPTSTGDPAPPKSSVASDRSDPSFAGSPFGLTGASRSNLVLSPTIRDGVSGLLRGATATEAYKGKYYSSLLKPSSAKTGFLDKIKSAASSFLKNNTAAGAIVAPTQPVSGLNYRADEDTYQLLVQSNRWTNFATNAGGKKSEYWDKSLNKGNIDLANAKSGAPAVRFFSGADSSNLNRLYVKGNIDNRLNSKLTYNPDITDKVGQLSLTDLTLITPISIISSDVNGANISLSDLNKKSNRYGDVVKVTSQYEYSDQLFNYYIFSGLNPTNPRSVRQFKTTYTDQFEKTVDSIQKSAENLKTKVAGAGNINYIVLEEFGKTQQFNTNPNELGFNYIKALINTKTGTPQRLSYEGKLRNKESLPTSTFKFPSILGKEQDKDRFINPTNNVDYVNSLGVLNEKDFESKYNTQFKGLGPDLIKFYFYDIVNDRFIPFNATVTNLSEYNNAAWDPISYLGRPDKLYYYGGFSREMNFGFKVVAHSVKELLPMWQRINYLAGLTRPSNYTSGTEGGFIIPPMIQLTLGDLYKNHFVTLNTVTIQIPEHASWELINEDYMKDSNIGWEFNIGNITSARSDKLLKGKVAQFPREVDVSVTMYVMEKDRPRTGKAIWGDAPVPLLPPEETGGELTFFKENYAGKNYRDQSLNKFSVNMRYDVDNEGK